MPPAHLTKALAPATRIDVEEVCVADQTCSGVKAGIEAAVHAMSAVFADDDTEALLLVDASDALNSLSRPAMLWNCRVLWPRCSTFLLNICRGSALIVLKASSSGSVNVLDSEEGTTLSSSKC